MLVFPFWNWNDEGDWWRGVLFFILLVGYRRGITRVLPEIRELSCLVLSLLLLLLVLLVLLLLLLLTSPLPSCAPQGAHAAVVTGRAIGVATARASRGWACTLVVSLGLGPCLAGEACLFVWTASVLAPVSLVGRLALTVVVVKLAPHRFFQH